MPWDSHPWHLPSIGHAMPAHRSLLWGGSCRTERLPKGRKTLHLKMALPLCIIYWMHYTSLISLFSSSAR